jgi:hemolysin activation/secretion protein
MGGIVNRHILAVHLDKDEVCVLAREVTDDRVHVEYMKHVLYTSFVLIRRIELEGRRLRVLERRLEFTALEREVYATTKVYVDKALSEEETKDLYESLTTFLQYPGDFGYLFNRLTSEKRE